MQDLYQRDVAALSKLQNLRFFPLAVTRGQGAYLFDQTGRKMLDFSASWGAASLGHGHPAIVDAVTRAAQDQAGCSILSSASLPAIELAEKLLEITPGHGERRVWLGHSGSDANETIARVVIAATGRPRIMAFSGAYHGGTAGSMAVSGHTTQEGVEKFNGLSLIPYPDPFRPYLEDPSGDSVLNYIEELFRKSFPPHEVAAFFFEPIQADGGLIVPPPGFFKKLANLCKKHGILTVCDEVKVGLGRTGKLHCFLDEDMVPDIVIFGKGLGGGLPISAAIGPAHIMNHQAAFSMQTLHGNPICAAAALAVLETIEKEKLINNAAHVGQIIQNELKALQVDQTIIGDVRGRGLAIGIELIEGEDKKPAAQKTSLIIYRAFELGAVLYYVGMHSNILELTPPLTLTAEQAKNGVNIIAQAIEDVENNLVSTEKLTGFEGW
ncbi:MAG: aspartate aminotransferase family protein [Alphaproteobacteria bacterium]|nr:aspartate aminotransferase family protein [Alphaproteobacteria bacterium]